MFWKKTCAAFMHLLDSSAMFWQMLQHRGFTQNFEFLPSTSSKKELFAIETQRETVYKSNAWTNENYLYSYNYNLFYYTTLI